MTKKTALIMLLATMLLAVACGAKKQKGELGEISKVSGNIEHKVQEMVSVPDKETFPTPMPTPSPTPTPIPTPKPTPKPKGDIPEKSYKSRNDFPYDNMELVDDATYAFLKEVYGHIDFAGEFKKGNEELYDSYLKKYKQVIDSKIPFTVMETGEKAYVKDYVTFSESYYQTDNYKEEDLPHGFIYSMFDMDGDDTPELVMWHWDKYVFKYLEETDEVVLWLEIETIYEHILGSNKLIWQWEGREYTLCELDENAEVDMGVFFVRECFWSNGNIAYLMTLPEYADESKEIVLTQAQKENAYFSEGEQLYFFPVSEAQYDILTKDFFEADAHFAENCKKVSHTYDDLFNQKEPCEFCTYAIEYLDMF